MPELKLLANKLREIFFRVFDELKDENLTNKNLDEKVLEIVKKYEISEENLEIKFSKPKDETYKAEGGRTPYDLLCFGKVNGKEFKIFINNKLGDLYSDTRNDVTTYNNLLRLYLGIHEQRLTSETTIDGDLVYKRISGEEIVSYAVFVVDKEKRDVNFFLLEEIKDDFYVNPRNTMFQIKYKPSLREPIDYYSFCIALIKAIGKALKKSLKSIKGEISVLDKIRDEIKKLRGG